MNNFTEFHDQCLQDWDTAVQSGKAGRLSGYPSEDYQGFFGYKDVSNLTPTPRQEAVSGLEQLLAYVAGARHAAEHRLIEMRSDTEAVVSYQRSFFKGDSLTMRFFVLQTWRIENNEWKIAREMAENI